jgi:anti-anti-sigma regulatory factor
MNNTTNSIYIAEKIAKIVSSRDLVSQLKKEVLKRKESPVKLDFTKVEFVSRSAAHEFLTLQDDMQNRLFKKRKVQFVNTSENIKQMFRVVAANMAMPKNQKPDVELKKTDIQTLLKNTSNC